MKRKKVIAIKDKKAQLIKKALIDALAKNLGNISKACEAVGCDRKMYYKFLNDPDFQSDVDAIEQGSIDFAEGKLKELINGVKMFSGNSSEGEIIYQTQPNVIATIFYLKTKGKKRGYVEKQEIENSGTQSITIEYVNDIATDDS